MKKLNVLGLNSGTSMDGIDAAVFSIEPLSAYNGGPPRLRARELVSFLHPFEPGFQKRLLTLVNSGNASLKDICLLNTALGGVFADAAQTAMRLCRAADEDIDLIGSHGQTIWHEPLETSFWGVETRASLQLGDAAVIASRTGLPVVSDFRANDLAEGGQGAPLVSFADEVLFGQEGRPIGILNLGGIANLTALDESGRAVFAFDTGPGNMLMDRACEKLFESGFDEDGRIAAAGTVDEEWLTTLMAHPYFALKPPKTTGREAFGHEFADFLIHQGSKRKLSGEDILATLTALTARSVAEAYSSYIRNRVELKEIVTGGGGGANGTLVSMLAGYWPHPVEINAHEKYGISTKFKESLLFALLAFTTYFGVPNNVPVCTGARRRVCLGKLIRGRV